MLGKYTAEMIQEFSDFVRQGKVPDHKEFRQARGVFVKQDDSVQGNLQQKAFVEHVLNLREKVDFEKPFRLYVISAKQPVSVKQASLGDSLEFAFMTYRGFSLAYEFDGEKITLVENLLRKHRLPADLWSKPGFQLWRWETQVFDVGEKVREVS